jgi:hypothetical protein
VQCHQLNALLKEAKLVVHECKKRKWGGWQRWKPTNLSQAALPLAQLLSKYLTSSPIGARGFPAKTLGGAGAALARASLSSRRIMSGSRNPLEDAADDSDTEDVAERGVRGGRAE